ncbi:MAG: right-handed parallel beta-helix repeat-containing protein [Candidatus Udaeobacter sp.]
MKANISSTIKAHLIRGAFYLLLLLAVCVIPFALAQRTTAKGNRPANVITVTNTNDSGPGSLRQALADANDGDTINFDVSLKGQTIALTSDELVIDKSITITGPGSDQLAVSVDFQYHFRIFHVMASPTVIIEGLTIGPSLYFYGCGIQNDQATLTINNCAVTGNDGLDSGAGISNGGTLTINNSSITGNGLEYQGTGVGISSSGTLIINNSIIRGNVSAKGQTDGGGIYSSGMLEITNSTIDGNSVGGPGGGIYNTGNAIITSSTISGNFSGGGYPGPQTGPGFGGGIFNGATLTISNSTISGNSVLTTDTGPGRGGGIFNSGSLQIANSTISGNSGTNGGAICNDAAPLEITNSILNAGDVGENIFNDGGTITSLGYNLSSDNGGGYLSGPGDQTNTDPILGPLQDNGGPTQTHRPYPQSPAIDAGDPSFTPPPFYDQRGTGFDRVVNGRIDIGSFEVQEGKPPPPSPTPTPTATPTAIPTSTPRPSPTPRPRPTPAPRP